MAPIMISTYIMYTYAPCLNNQPFSHGNTIMPTPAPMFMNKYVVPDITIYRFIQASPAGHTGPWKAMKRQENIHKYIFC
jgi:hypothetical protein